MAKPGITDKVSSFLRYWRGLFAISFSFKSVLELIVISPLILYNASHNINNFLVKIKIITKNTNKTQVSFLIYFILFIIKI